MEILDTYVNKLFEHDKRKPLTCVTEYEEGFKLPIYYNNSKKELNETIFEDLELLESHDSSNCLYDCVFDNKSDLSKKILSNDNVGTLASEIAKDKIIRKIVHKFQIYCAYKYPKNLNGSCLDGRDITYKIIPDANFKFFITASLKVRSLRRYRELKKLGKLYLRRTILLLIKFLQELLELESLLD